MIEAYDSLLNLQGDDGNCFVLGLEHWCLYDDGVNNWSETDNYGIATLQDNAYDGVEARRAAGKDARGFLVGGEEADYGNLLGPLGEYLRAVPRKIEKSTGREPFSGKKDWGERKMVEKKMHASSFPPVCLQAIFLSRDFKNSVRQNMKTSIAVLTAGLGLLVLAGRAQATTLVRAGHAEAVIVVPAGNKAAGAADLQTYVEKASGAKLPIVTEDKLGDANHAPRVFVGPCRAASRVVDLKALQPEGFVIKTDGGDLFIVGRDATETGMQVAGTFYGVCEFLERYVGVRWLMQGPLGEVVPKHATLDSVAAQAAAPGIRRKPSKGFKRTRICICTRNRP